ncbi:hypothetical protein NHX12_030660 [Muraenolepis orangiensis]|uniref:Uncharacterized protein n=1 Tax=Muraenolepis orangiensis TaxID=630683 RepID=A0A9Q0ECI0_9TELE|nr:hypothetical protein NHX12_030660 [Muraenolepis orangiensis]
MLAMEGVLEGACVLGVCKLACSLYFLPAFSGLISFCCCCLLMFTDVLVTGFLLFLWLADPWPPQLTPHSDLIALRFLLFLGHTYAAVLLLTAPLVVAETVLREVWPCDGDGCRTAGGEECEVLECGVALEKGDTRPGADRGQDGWRQLSQAIGYPCCLSVWMVSGLWVGYRGQSLEELAVAECLHTSDSLLACLPRMFPSPVGPFWKMVLLGLLLLFLVWELAVTNIGVGDNNNNNSWQHLVPALFRPSSLTTKPWLAVGPEPRCVDSEKTSSSCLAPTADPWTSDSGAGRTALDCAGPETERGLGSLPRCHGRPGRVVPIPLGVIVTAGLMGMLSLCTLPLTLSANVLLVQTMQAVVEGCVETWVAQRRRRWQGETVSTLLKT